MTLVGPLPECRLLLSPCRMTDTLIEICGLTGLKNQRIIFVLTTADRVGVSTQKEESWRAKDLHSAYEPFSDLWLTSELCMWLPSNPAKAKKPK